MKKNTAIFLFLCLFVPFLGTYTWLQFKKHQVKETVKRQILVHADKNELVTLTFKASETTTLLHWEHDSEFEYKGQMYDVVEAQTKGDSIAYICWWDHAETALNQQLEHIVDITFGTDPQNHAQQEHLKDFYKSLYFAPEQTYYFTRYFLSFYNLKSTIVYRNSIYLPFFFPPLSPPPEIMS